MSMTKRAKAVLCVFAVPVAAWAAASLYFTIAGLDASGDCLCEYLPEQRNLAPCENAYVAIKEFSYNVPSNGTPLFCDHRLRTAYLDGTTNRLDLAEAARAYLAAESNTVATAERILAAKGIDVPFGESLQATEHFCMLMRIANIYKVKATYEAAQGDLAAGRQSLLDVYRIGRFLQTSDSLSLGISTVIGSAFCGSALTTGATPLFAPDEDEAWRAKLRELAFAELAGDKERAKTATKRSVAGYRRATIHNYETNRTMLVGHAISGHRGLLDLVRLTSEQLSDERHKGFELRFLAALASACPGYARYSFQPNRTLGQVRGDAGEFCRKIDEDSYDVEYAFRPADVRKHRFSRNWIGDALAKEECHEGFYRLFFRTRFFCRAFAATMACRSYKAKHGKYPEALSDLVPEFLAEVPRDPFDGGELRYNATDHFIWTRGEKLDFDGKVEFLDNGKPRIKGIRNYRCVYFLDERPR